jgi:hypothetical protein
LKEVLPPLEEGEEETIVVNNIGLVCPKKKKKKLFKFFLQKIIMTMGWVLPW